MTQTARTVMVAPARVLLRRVSSACPSLAPRRFVLQFARARGWGVESEEGVCVCVGGGQLESERV